MENPVLQIKDALIRVLKKIEPDTDVFLKKSKVQIRPMEWNSLKPGILWI